MSGQMSLGGFADAVPTDRLFFAVFPDDAASETIARLAEDIGRQHGLRGAALKRERLHVTLHHLGDYAGLPAAVVEEARCAAANVVATPFEVTFDHVKSFSGRAQKNPCVLAGTQADTPLQRLRRQLGECLIQAGLGKQVTREFTPHVTLRYETALLPEQTIAPIAWMVREFVLVHSLLGKTEHRIVQRWSLVG